MSNKETVVTNWDSLRPGDIITVEFWLDMWEHYPHYLHQVEFKGWGEWESEYGCKHPAMLHEDGATTTAQIITIHRH